MAGVLQFFRSFVVVSLYCLQNPLKSWKKLQKHFSSEAILFPSSLLGGRIFWKPGASENKLRTPWLSESYENHPLCFWKIGISYNHYYSRYNCIVPDRMRQEVIWAADKKHTKWTNRITIRYSMSFRLWKQVGMHWLLSNINSVWWLMRGHAATFAFFQRENQSEFGTCDPVSQSAAAKSNTWKKENDENEWIPSGQFFLYFTNLDLPEIRGPISLPICYLLRWGRVRSL